LNKFDHYSSSCETREEKKADSEMLRAIVVLGRQLLAERKSVPSAPKEARRGRIHQRPPVQQTQKETQEIWRQPEQPASLWRPDRPGHPHFMRGLSGGLA